jgi:hypothetical protein
MRLTVGPLPPAVYWRRRAVVLGALVCAVFLVSYSCGGARSAGSPENRSGNGASPAPSQSLLTPVIGRPPGSDASSSTAPPASGGAQPTGPCTDAELIVTVNTEGNRAEFAVGAYVRIYLKIKNVSTRSCSRDVGATQQELRIMQGARQMWSSDACGAPGGSFIRTLSPGQVLDDFNVLWNGRETTNCQTKPLPAPGAYQLSGRVGTKWSEPVTFTVTPGK